MDPNPTPFPGKNQPMKPKPNRKPREPAKPISIEPSIARRNRVFGTVRNANIPPARTPAVEKPAIKAIPRKQPEWNPTTRVPIPEPARKKKSSSENKPKPKEEEETLNANVQTPAASAPPPSEPKSGGSAYLSAKICSKCRFDRLETASYWLGQIKLSESVGNHFVSAAFFMLAFESKAEPIRKLGFELKKYLARNGQLRGQTEWRKVCVSYGILKDEKMAMEMFEPVDQKPETPNITHLGFHQQIQTINDEDEKTHIALFVKKMKQIEI